MRKALIEAKHHQQSRLLFPSGRFLIGSQTPDEDYIVLISNIELRGQKITLIVDGSARWFGLATGPEATGDLTIQVKDLTKGNQFILMANMATTALS